MEPLSAEEKEKHELDTDADLFWRKDGNIGPEAQDA
jgi:hypothetical protein